MTADLAMLERWRAHRTGLAPYYPLLYSLVIGMGAKDVFEFGTGESTVILFDAVRQTGGRLLWCSPDPVPEQGGGPVRDTSLAWRVALMRPHFHFNCTSAEALAQLKDEDAFDLVLHDGSHSAEVITADLLGILPRVRDGGLVLIHDVLHSYVGEQMRAGVGHALRHELGFVRVDTVTLPFAFGLQILQVSAPHGNTPVSIGPDKPSSPHHTLRWGEQP
jgi:predicted O-methyltransferase YrrM